ncbi:MAG: bifunctional folylpolyglutamate synthase/dihydrofolate synthase [Hymenobacteraceae bacterium]|nr:bifunctional folylpolyglutamate synthase/dihydrofolate synthase [Hymenobacteraceae bacterium]
MTYAETLDYLFGRLPMFQRVGAAAYTRSLANIEALCRELGHPERAFRSVHVAGTNGKGSSSHALAAVLQTAGYRTGLYTSPHLVDFTERVRLDGRPVLPAYVVEFVARNRALFEELNVSFFEMAVALAFPYFADERVDIASIEVGLGGRPDSTNVIEPLISLITNISYDHQDLLGDTLPLIAAEKAGIIKAGVPVVISQTQPEVAEVFQRVAATHHARLRFADQEYAVDRQAPLIGGGGQTLDVVRAADGAAILPNLHLDLAGEYQRHNLPGILATVDELRAAGFDLPETVVRAGLATVQRRTGLRGRWQILGERPLVVADTGHNEAGLRAALAQVVARHPAHLHMVLGMVGDKAIGKMLALLPTANATGYFCAARIPRALPAAELQHQAAAFGLMGEVFSSVAAAVAAARAAATVNDAVYIGGSTFVVAEVAEVMQ